MGRNYGIVDSKHTVDYWSYDSLGHRTCGMHVEVHRLEYKEEEMTSEKKKREKVKLVFLGVAVYMNKKVHAYCPYKDGKPDLSSKFTMKAKLGYSVGNILEVEIPMGDTETFYVKTAKVVDNIEDRNLVREWELNHQLSTNQLALNKGVDSKLIEKMTVKELMEYSRVNWRKRKQVIAWLLDKI